jgi:hypothetical protein
MFIFILDWKAKSYDRERNVDTYVEEFDEEINFEGIRKFGTLFWFVNFGTFIGYGCLAYNNNTQSLL